VRTLFAAFALLVCGLANAATLYVTEFKERPPVTYQAAWTPSVADQAITITGASAQSAAFQYNTALIRVHADVACHVVIGGTNPVATASSMRMLAGQTEYFLVQPGQLLAVILE
jgi:hypothetical protein